MGGGGASIAAAPSGFPTSRGPKTSLLGSFGGFVQKASLEAQSLQVQFRDGGTGEGVSFLGRGSNESRTEILPGRVEIKCSSLKYCEISLCWENQLCWEKSI